MKPSMTRSPALVFILTFLVSAFTGCRGITEPVDAEKIVYSLLNEVTYSGELTRVGDHARLYFDDLQENVEVELYMAGGYFADEVAWLVFDEEGEAKAGEKIIADHIAELRKQFLDYVPEEVGKIDHAVVVRNGKHIFLCITDDYKKAKQIISGELVHAEDKRSEKPEDLTAEKDTGSEQENMPSAETVPEGKYPQISSKSGEYSNYDGAVMRVDSAAYEWYDYVDATAQSYADIVNKTAASLNGNTTVYVLAIPTAVGVVLPDDIVEKIPGYDDQGEAIERIYDKLSADVKTVNCFENMMLHRDEYLYFRTDFHWNGKGAYYAYESFCDTKGINAIPLSERSEKKFGNFLGALYWNNADQDAAIGNTPDTVEAYLPKSTAATMTFTDRKGNTYPWDIVSDVTNYKTSMKYSTFAGGDNPISVFKRKNSMCRTTFTRQ